MADDRPRVTVRLADEELEVLDRHARRRNVSRSEYLAIALRFYEAYETHDVDIHDPLLYRIDQLVESQANIVSRLDNLEHLVVDSFKSLLALTRGDNYLLDEVGTDEGGGERG